MKSPAAPDAINQMPSVPDESGILVCIQPIKPQYWTSVDDL